MKTEEDIFGLISYHIPRVCEKCGGVMVYKGVGEYECEDCHEPGLDDYGKVRNYIEKHPGCNAQQIELATGVSRKAIRQMLKESRLEIAESSKTFLMCEICGKSIRSGRYCNECEIKMHRRLEDQARENLRKDIQGFGMAKDGESGQKRFTRG